MPWGRNKNWETLDVGGIRPIYAFMCACRVGADDGNRVVDGWRCDDSGYHDNKHSNALHHGNDRAHVLCVRRRATDSHIGHHRRLSNLAGRATILNQTTVQSLYFLFYPTLSPRLLYKMSAIHSTSLSSSDCPSSVQTETLHLMCKLLNAFIWFFWESRTDDCA